jgi:xanthosine utilization system XapX-like protein
MMKYALIITPSNVITRIAVAVMLILGGLNVWMQAEPVAYLVGLIFILLGAAILVFAMRWFWRLFIVAWFR